MVASGYQVFDHDPRVLKWAQAAWQVAQSIDLLPDRCGETWHVGVDDLPNNTDGAISGVPLEGPWQVSSTLWHRAQLSVIYSGYPRRDATESEAAHQFRMKRCAAHMDGLLPEGPHKRRHLREPHAFILGIPLGDVPQSPLVVWPGSHLIMRRAFEREFFGIPPDEWGGMDVTDAYQAARREVFDHCVAKEVALLRGQSIVLHRHLIHGVAPWRGSGNMPRTKAYFRPQLSDISTWL